MLIILLLFSVLRRRRPTFRVIQDVPVRLNPPIPRTLRARLFKCAFFTARARCEISPKRENGKAASRVRSRV